MSTDKKNITILIVDDEEENRRILSEILGDLGYRVIDRPDGMSALSAVKEEAGVDLVVTDYRMPDMNGLELITTLRRTLPEVPVIMITGHGSIENYFRSLSLGVFEYINNKPVGKREFERIVQAALHAGKDAA